MKRKKMLALLLILSLTVSSLMGCSRGESVETGQEKSLGTDATNTEKGTSTEETTKNQEPYEFTIFSNIIGTDGLTDLDKQWAKKIEDKFNVTIKFESPASSNYDESVQLALASGEYPDVMFFSDHTSNVFIDACTDGVFIPLNDYLDDCPDIMAHTYDVSWEALKVLKDNNDNGIYAIPRTSMARADGYVFRQDWLDAIGYTDFKEGESITLDQLFDILVKFSKEDPDGNGIDDTYGLGAAVNSDGNFTIGSFFGATFGLSSGWRDYDGEIIDLQYSKDRDNMKKALEFANKLWEAGAVDIDAATIKNDVALERFYKGITGLRGDFAGWMYDYQSRIQELNSDGTLSYVTAVVENEDDEYTAGSFSTGFWGLWAISSDVEKPERIMEVYNYKLSEEGWTECKNGIEGVTWNNVDGVATATDQFTTQLISRNFVRRNDDASYFTSLDAPEDVRTRLASLIDICVSNYSSSMDNGYKPPISTDFTFIDYKTKMDVQITRIITGDTPVSEWDNILDGWYKAGGQQYVDEMQTYIKSIQ